MSRARVIAGLGLCLLAGIATAADQVATDQLLTRMQRISHLQGEFEQRQYSDDNKVLATSSGTFKLLRPFFFSWEIRTPDNQLIVANAEYLWHYDIDLQTATRRPVVGNVEASPLQVLGGDETVLRDQYNVEQLNDNSFTLEPIDGQHGFRRLAVQFDGDTIASMDIVDKLGQRVVIDFKQVDSTTALTDNDFQFIPPTDADLFFYDE